MARVRLRPVTLADLDDIMTWINDPEVVANIANIKPPITRRAEAKWLRRALRNPNERLYSVLDARTGAYLGQGGIHQIYWPARNGRLALVVKKEVQGRGYGTAATVELMRKAFEELGLHKVWCIVWEDNPKTVHLNRDRLKLRQEGRLIDEYSLGGRYHTMLRLYMLEGEFRRRWGRRRKTRRQESRAGSPTRRSGRS
jgi:RimJ/RimL family protein N-acetyltransferase